MQHPSVGFVACSMLKRPWPAVRRMQLALQKPLNKYCKALYALQSVKRAVFENFEALLF